MTHRAITDLRSLWRTRHSSGLPRPFRWGVSPPSRSLRVRQWVTGHSWHSVVPLWRQVLGIPLRPWRFAKMVRGIARTRALGYGPTDYDDVP